MLCYNELKDRPTRLLAFTGLEQGEFEELGEAFEKAWQEDVKERAKRKKNRKRKSGGGRGVAVKEMPDRLLFILFYLKTYPLQEVLAYHFGISQGQANRFIHRTGLVLKVALGKLNHLPEREGERLAQAVAEYESLSFAQDGSERRRQRPKVGQKEYYSGKKKCHTVKNHLVVHPESRRICFLSRTVPGKKHDKKLADESNLTLPYLSTLEQDTGYQGFELDNIIIIQPKKKLPKQELSMADEFFNHAISAGRVIVENIISGIKRCRILKDVFRNWKNDFDDLVMELACGLHNLRTAFRHSPDTIDLFDLI